MKIKLTPFVKFFIITSIFIFVLGHLNPAIVETFLKIKTPFGPDFIPTQILTYQLVPTGFLDLALSSLMFAVYVSDLERYYGSVRITAFFFGTGIIHVFFIQSLSMDSLSMDYTMFGSAPAFMGFLFLFLLRNWNNKLSFIILTTEGSTVFCAGLALTVILFIEMITSGSTEPSNLSSVILACVFYKALDGKIRNKKLQA